jgi:hypothetical protein
MSEAVALILATVLAAEEREFSNLRCFSEL